MSGPIVRKYGFPNYEKIFGERPFEHGLEEGEATADQPAEAELGSIDQKDAAQEEKHQAKERIEIGRDSFARLTQARSPHPEEGDYLRTSLSSEASLTPERARRSVTRGRLARS